MSRGTEQDSVHSGSSFDSYLDEEGIRNEVEGAAVKRVLAWQFEREMEKQQKTKQGMARELKTSRSQLDRLLDPANTAVSLETLTRAANVLGKRLVFEIRDHDLVRKTRHREAANHTAAARNKRTAAVRARGSKVRQTA
jgi:antitoxin HicB